MRTDRFAARNAARCQQFLRAEQHARRAEAALQRVARDEGLLQIGDLAAVGHPLDGIDARAVALHRPHQAAAHHRAVDAHAAGPADPMLAAHVAAGEPGGLAQEVNQRRARVDAFAHLLAVHADGNIVEALAHDGWPSWRATRRSSTPARWTFTAGDAWTSAGGSRSCASARTAASASPTASACSAWRARTGVGPTPKTTSRRPPRRLPSARAQAASPTMA